MLVAVVVTYSVDAALLDRCVRALATDEAVDHVVVVDTDGQATLADDLLAGDPFAGVEIVAVANRGYGAAANLGFRRALELGADRLALLNDDAVAQVGWLPPLLAELVDGVGAAQPALLAGDGSVASLGVEIDRYGAGHDLGQDEAYEPGAAPRDIAAFTGGAVVFTDGFLAATGGFDERFFLYYEDVDLAARGARLGWRYRVVPASVVVHDRGTTTSGLGGRTRYLQERNRLWHAARFGSPATIAAALWLSVRRLRHDPRSVHARALAAGVAGMPRRLVERARRTLTV